MRRVFACARAQSLRANCGGHKRDRLAARLRDCVGRTIRIAAAAALMVVAVLVAWCRWRAADGSPDDCDDCVNVCVCVLAVCHLPVREISLAVLDCVARFCCGSFVRTHKLSHYARAARAARVRVRCACAFSLVRSAAFHIQLSLQLNAIGAIVVAQNARATVECRPRRRGRWRVCVCSLCAYRVCVCTLTVYTVGHRLH